MQGEEALRQAIAAYRATRHNEPALIAQGAVYTILGDDRRMTRQVLDAIIPDQPFMMFAADHHTCWANTIALERPASCKAASLAPVTKS